MAEVTLTSMWIHLGSDLSTSIQVPLNRLQANSNEVQGEVERYASGRRRYVRWEGEDTSYSVQLVMVPLTDLRTLEGWTGTLLKLRAPKGWGMYGTYNSVQVGEQAGPTDVVRSVSFTFNKVTATDEV
jgi:hypothetical protein